MVPAVPPRIALVRGLVTKLRRRFILGRAGDEGTKERRERKR